MGSPKQRQCRGLVAVARSLQGRTASLVRDLGGSGARAHRACWCRAVCLRNLLARSMPSSVPCPTARLHFVFAHAGHATPVELGSPCAQQPVGLPRGASRRGGRSPCPCPAAHSAARPGRPQPPIGQHVGTLQPQARARPAHEARPVGGAGRGGPGARSRCQPPAAPQVPELRSQAGRERGRGRGAALARGPGEPPARCGAARPQEAPISAGQWRRRAVTGQIWPPAPAGTKGTGPGGDPRAARRPPGPVPARARPAPARPGPAPPLPARRAAGGGAAS